jgi:gamma-glutamyl-gamma-aminobutyrate hydrolase PuuD
MRCRCWCPPSGPRPTGRDCWTRCDGLLLTGSESNVEPHHYGGPASAPGTLHDPNRDATTLPLIPRAVAAGLPVLAICRGFQEMNVAYGGTLGQRCTRWTGTSIIARTNPTPRRAIRARARGPPGAGRAAAASPARIACRSIHCIGRACRPWGQGLAVEARAPDGVIEAFRVATRANFASACSGIRNGSFRRIHFRARCSPPSARLQAARKFKVIYGQHDSAVPEGTRHFGSRGDHSRHGGCRARQAHAGREIRRRGGHAPARGDLPADRDRRLPGRPERHESVGHRYRPARGSEDGAGRAHGRPNRPRR